MSIGLQALNSVALQQKASHNSNLLTANNYPYNDCNANELVRCITDWFILNGHFATRIADTSIRKHNKYSRQAIELPDILACIYGQFVAVTVIYGQEPFSPPQKETMQAMVRAGAWVYIARDFDSFYKWYNTYIPNILDSSSATYHQRHPIPYLATPDLFNSEFKQ